MKMSMYQRSVLLGITLLATAFVIAVILASFQVIGLQFPGWYFLLVLWPLGIGGLLVFGGFLFLALCNA